MSKRLIVILIIVTLVGIMGSNEKTLAQNVAPLIVKVVGAQGQNLSGARVVIEDSTGTTVFNGFTDEQGSVRVDVAYGTYSILVDYQGFINTATASVSSQAGTVSTIATNVFIEIFGQAMTFATFVLWIIVLALIISIPTVIIVRIRKKKPPPPPPPPEPE